MVITMNAEQILKLIDAGYTKVEIEQMSFIEEPKSEETAPEESRPTDDPIKPEEPLKSEAEQRLDRIEGILEKIAANNISGSNAPETPPKRDVVKEMLDNL